MSNVEYTQEELARIFRQVSGQLFIPDTYRRYVEQTGPDIGVFYKFTDACIEKDPQETFWKTASTIPFDQALLTLAATSSILAQTRFDPQTHSVLTTNFVRQEYLRRLSTLAKSEEGRQPTARIIFNRCGNLTALKALMSISPLEFKPQRFDPLAIGDLELLSNELIAGSKLGDSAEEVSELDFMVEFLPSWEFYNPPDLAYGLARIVMMISHLGGDDEKILRQREAIGLDLETMRFDRLTLDDFIAVIFGIYSHLNSFSPKALFENPGLVVIDQKKYLENVNFPVEILDEFLDSRGIDIEGLRREITGGAGLDKQEFFRETEKNLFGTQMLVFKRYPLIRLGDGKVLVLDLPLVTELLVYGVFWHLFDTLSSAVRPDFLSLWGRVVELYIFDLIRHSYPEGANVMSLEVDYDGGEVDALVDFGRDVIIFEFKSSLLTQDAKYSRNRELFEEELYRKYVEDEGEAKAVRQLANAVAAISESRIETVLKPPPRVYPVFVGYEPSLQCMGMNKYLDVIFKKFLPTTVSGMNVRPLTVMSVGEFEELLPYLHRFSLPQLLDERYGGGDTPFYSVSQTLHQFRQDKSIPTERNEFLLSEFEKIYQNIVARYRGSD